MEQPATGVQRARERRVSATQPIGCRMLKALLLAALLALAGPANAGLNHRGSAPIQSLSAFGAKTPAGFGGVFPGGALVTGLSFISTTCPGATGAELAIDGNSEIVPTFTDGTYVAASYGKKSALAALGLTQSCVSDYNVTMAGGTTRYHIPITPHVASIRSMYGATVSADDTASPGAGSGVFQLEWLLSVNQTTSAHQGVALGDTVSIRDSPPGSGALNTNPQLNPLDNTNYRILFPTIANDWVGAGRITITCDTPNTSTDANGNPVDGGGCTLNQIWRNYSSIAPTAATVIPIDWTYLTFSTNVASASGGFLDHFTGTCCTTNGTGQTFTHMRFEHPGVSAAQLETCNCTDLFLHNGDTAAFNHHAGYYNAMLGGSTDASGETLAALAPVTALNVIGEGQGLDFLDMANCNWDVENSFVFNPNTLATGHNDIVQLDEMINLACPVAGTFKHNIAVRNQTGANQLDFQLFFANQEVGSTKPTGALITGNIYYGTYGDIVYLSQFNNPTITANTLITDVLTNNSAIFNTIIQAISDGGGGATDVGNAADFNLYGLTYTGNTNTSVNLTGITPQIIQAANQAPTGKQLTLTANGTTTLTGVSTAGITDLAQIADPLTGCLPANDWVVSHVTNTSVLLGLAATCSGPIVTNQYGAALKVSGTDLAANSPLIAFPTGSTATLDTGFAATGSHTGITLTTNVQTGTVTVSSNFNFGNTGTLLSRFAAYQARYPNLPNPGLGNPTTTLVNRAAAIQAFTPNVAGSDALNPPNNFGEVCWAVPGTPFDPTQHCAPAT